MTDHIKPNEAPLDDVAFELDRDVDPRDRDDFAILKQLVADIRVGKDAGMAILTAYRLGEGRQIKGLHS